MAKEHENITCDYIRGTCKLMCPEKEIKMREQEGLIHVLELPPGTKPHKHTKAHCNLMVKCFNRSAAGQHSSQVDELRPPDVLYQTVCHLLTKTAERKDVAWNVVYDFIFDRLRAVRQDMVIQGLNAHHCIKILEPIVRFHAYAGYRLCEEPISMYDPVINRTHMLECLKRLLLFYDTLESSETNNLKENQRGASSICAGEARRMEMEAVYVLATMGQCDALSRILKLECDRDNVNLKIALSMSLATRNGNYVRTCRLLLLLPPFLAFIAAQQLPSLRRHALQVMSVAYSSRNLIYPLSKLQTLLLYLNTEQALQDCLSCGITVKDENIMFSKISFNSNAQINNFVRVDYVEKHIRLMRFSELFFPGDKHSVLT